MIFAFIIKFVVPVLFFGWLIWFIWPKAAVTVEEVEQERKPILAKAKKMAKKNKEEV